MEFYKDLMIEIRETIRNLKLHEDTYSPELTKLKLLSNVSYLEGYIDGLQKYIDGVNKEKQVENVSGD